MDPFSSAPTSCIHQRWCTAAVVPILVVSPSVVYMAERDRERGGEKFIRDEMRIRPRKGDILGRKSRNFENFEQEFNFPTPHREAYG